MKFLDTDNVCIKQRRAKLVLDLYELLHQTAGTFNVATMAQWCEVRGHSNKAAALRDLYRKADELASFKVVLAFGVNEETQAFEIDLRAQGVRALVSREIDAATRWLATRGHRKAIERLVRASVAAFTQSNRGMEGFDEALAIHEATTRAALSRQVDIRSQENDDEEGEEEVMSSCNVTLRRVRVTWSRKTGPRPVELVKPSPAVEEAVRLARSKTAFKVKLIEIGKLLDCSPRTAARFVQRVRGGRVSSAQ